MSFDLPGLFAAGLLTFLSPCVLPLVPIYLGLLGGASVSDVRAGGARGRLVATASAFSLGLASAFVALGLGASAAGALLQAHRETLLRVAGAVAVAFGLKLLGILRLPGLDRERRPLLARAAPGGSLLASFAFGGAFALGWTPCIGPVLGSVLTYTASSGASPARGAVHLGAYAAGLVAPLLLAAAFAPRALRLLDRVKPHLRKVELATGVLLAVAGALLATDRLMVLMPSAGGGEAALAAAPEVTPPPSATGGDGATCEVGPPGGAACDLPDVGAPADPVAGALAAQLASSSGPRVVELTSRSCPVCRSMAPVVAEAERGCPGARVQERPVEEPEGRELARRHGVRGVPTFLVLDASGREVRRLVGAQPVEAIEEALQLATGRICDARPLTSPGRARGG